MSMKHHRHYLAGNGALAARAVAAGNRSTSRTPSRPGRNNEPGSSLPANVVELYPGTAQGAYPVQERRRTPLLMGSEAGMATAEYAIATLAAVGFAGLLVFILRSDEVRGFLLTLIRTALALP